MGHILHVIGVGLGLQCLYSATSCADNILGCFTILLQNQIARVDSFTNLTKRWVFRFRLNASISSHNLISFGKICECMLAKSIMLQFWNLLDTFFIGSYGISFAFWWGDHFFMYVGAFPWSPLKTISSVLNSIRYLTGSQWSETSTGVMRSYFFRLKASLAAVFCTRWSFLMIFSGSPSIKLLQ